MADEFREPFVNPYVDEESDEARFSTFVTMDEAHERWNNGTWQGKVNFELDPSMFEDSRGLKLDKSGKSQDKPKENRFAFDLQKDIINADELTSRLDENAYTGNYRPVGSIGSTLSNITLDRLKYNALADIKEELPEDLSYLYGEGEGSGFRKREVRLRSYNRLSKPIDERRAEVEKMLPEENKESPEAIMADIRRRRDIEDAKSGIDSRAGKRHPRLGIYDVHSPDGSAEDFYTAEDQYDIEGISEHGSWRGSIPEQDGLVPDSKELPYFGRYSRKWSDMDETAPSRDDLLSHTVDTIYEDNSAEKTERFHSKNGEREYYVPDEEFDPYNRYRRLERSRRKLNADKNVLTQSIMSGEFNNPYVQISNKRLKALLHPDMRGPGHVADPEGLTDPALLYEWNMGYSRIHSKDNNYKEWLDEQSRLADLTEQSRYRGSHRTGRPGAYIQREKPYGSERKYPRGNYTEHQRQRRDMQEQLQRATEQGIADGREIIRQEQKAKRDEQQRRMRLAEEERRRAYEQQRRAYDRQMELYRQQQEQLMHNAEHAAPPRKKPPAPRKQGRQAPRNAQQQAQPTLRKPQYGPMGFYTPKPEPSDDRRGSRPAQRRK
ncbi:MAG: hypothetical protein IJM51_02120 [Clostridia bacterium]|nr:hypothetical protein [Clostridia bacterium]